MILSRRKHRQNTYCLFFLFFLLSGIGGFFSAYTVPLDFFQQKARDISILLLILGTLGYFFLFLYSTLYHKLYRGVRYCILHKKLTDSIEQELLDACHYVERFSGMTKVAVLPKIKVEFNDGKLTTGKVYIRNHIKYHKKLEDISLSSALEEYIVDNAYISDDENWFIFEFISSSLNSKLVFHSIEDFKRYAKKSPCYHYFIDGRTNSIDLCSTLIVGLTGSGKTYALYSLILQSLLWRVKPILYFSDPKASSLSVLGEAIDRERTAETTEEIIDLLRTFVLEMEKRKKEVKEKLSSKLEATAKDFQMPAHIMIIDEFSSFISVIKTMDKKARDEVNKLLRNIVLQGRQLNFHLFIIMQKSDSEDIPTAIRSNLICKIVLGQANRTTYQTAFELPSTDIPERRFSQGDGLMTYQGLTRNTPRVVSFPYLDFDILQSIRDMTTGLPFSKTGAPTQHIQ